MSSNVKIDIADTLETMLIMLMESKELDNIEQKKYKFHKYGKTVNGKYQLLADVMLPTKTYIGDLIEERDLTIDRQFLLRNPVETIGEQNEIAGFYEDKIIWFGYRKIKKPPLGFNYLGKAAFFYEAHAREWRIQGYEDYNQFILALDKNGKVLPSINSKNNASGNVIAHFNKRLVLAASMIEDAHRTNAMLAQVKDQSEILFPVPLDDYKKVFSDRDKRPNEIRRKSILHWVTKHIRKTQSNNLTIVNRHIRGIDDFTVDGLRVKISPNTI